MIMHKVQGYEDYLKMIEILKGQGKILVYFSGSAGEDGESWCPDCRITEPFLQDALKDFEQKDFHFIYVGITKTDYMNRECSFRKDEKLKLTTVPTILVYDGQERLNGNECFDAGNIHMILEAFP